MQSSNDSLSESMKLRDYSKNLLNVLKLHQLNINKTVNDINDDDDNKKIEFNPLEFNALITNINNFKTNVASAVNNSAINLLKNPSNVNLPTSITTPKTVSFKQNLISSPRERRAKSVPPRLNDTTKLIKNKKKFVNKNSKQNKKKSLPRSILKKHKFQSTSVFDTDDTDSMDEETKSIYNEINDLYLKNTEYSIKLKDVNTKDRNSLIDCLTKTRQKYLNHVYNDSNDSLLKINYDNSKKHNIKVKGVKTMKADEKKNIKIKIDDDLKSYSDSEENKKVVKKKHSTFSIKNIPKNNKTLLGYDWIKDALENGKNVSFNQSDSYWNDLINFRNQNRNDCISSENYNDTNSMFYENDLSIQDNDIENLRHKCIHTYTINERLFPVPTYVNENGESMCPVCKSSRKDPTNYDPQFCKISIPQSRLYTNIKICPQKRSDIKRDDTFSLAEHCVAGYESVNDNINFKKSKNIDLKSATSRPNNLIKMTLDDVKKIRDNKDPAVSIYNKGHAMRYELENQHLKRLKELMPKLK